ncbi:MAG: hypothetical protein WCG06_03335 [Candidatus Omnitrophota bacterium]
MIGSNNNPLRQFSQGVVPSWDLYACAFLTMMLFFQVCQWTLFPRFLDIYYHLGVVRGFAEAGGYTPWALWECAPVGRPQLYPPFLHWLLLGPFTAGVPFIEIARAVDCLSFPALLASGWMLARRLTGACSAFVWLILFSSLYSVYLAASTLPAFNLAFILSFLSLTAAVDSKSRLAAVLAGLVIYTHLLAAVFLIAVYAIWTLSAGAGKRAGLIRILSAALIIGAPMLLYAGCWSGWFARPALRENNFFDVDPWLFAASIAGIYFAKKTSREPGLVFALFLSGFVGAFFYPVRCLTGQGLFGVAMLATIAIEALAKNTASRFGRPAAAVGSAAVMLMFVFVLPVLEVNLQTRTAVPRWFDRTLSRFCVNADRLSFKVRGFTVYFPQDYARLAELIEANSKRSDILWSGFAHGAGILSMLTGRPTSSAMLAEVLPGAAFDPVAAAKISVWFKDRQGSPTAFMKKMTDLYRLKLAGQTDLAFVYVNHAPAVIPQRSKHLVVSWWIVIGYFIVLSIAACRFVGLPRIS